MIFGFLRKFWIDLSGQTFVEKIFRYKIVDFNIFVSGFSPGFGKGLVKSLPNGFGKDLIKPLPNPTENLETIFLNQQIHLEKFSQQKIVHLNRSKIVPRIQKSYLENLKTIISTRIPVITEK